MPAGVPDENDERRPAGPAGAGGEVGAAVVTFRPDATVIGNVEAVRRQVAHLLVVDNDASASSRALLAPLAGKPGVELVFNAGNRGTAAALNQAVEWALRADFAWLGTFDQDSTVPEGFVAGLLAAHAGFPERERVAVLAPLYRDRRLGFVYSPSGPVARDQRGAGPVSVTATSGNLLSVRALRAVGGFRDDFFIDCVDFEFCLRCRRRGWQVLEVREVVLEHEQGHWEQRRWLWKHPRVNDYDADRRYYQARNRLVVYARFGTVDPRWTLRDAWGYACDGAKLLLFGENRGRKIRAMLGGGWDALTGRMGPRRA